MSEDLRGFLAMCGWTVTAFLIVGLHLWLNPGDERRNCTTGPATIVKIAP